jgi:O-antigen ligase
VTHAFAAACIGAAAVTYLYGRETPTNPIPWAICAGMCVAALVPRSMDTSFSAACRWAWAAAAILGILGVTWSLTRGAYGIWPWSALVWLALWLRVAFKAGRRTVWLVTALGVLAATVIAGVVLMATWKIVSGTPLTSASASRSLQANHPLDRIEQGLREAVAGLRSQGSVESANTSVGGRLMLWRIAANAFAESPLVGVGNRGLAERIRTEATRLNSDVLRYADDQAHNEYLQVAAMYGLWGIAAMLLTIAGLVLAAAKLASEDMYAAWQLAGVTFMHATGALTNVNFSQNYYGIMMGLVVALILLSRRKRTD